ncbi:MAG TPA: hypothetical protein VLM89_11050 [Phycisphaerae bacterium]|nr:hypothetical protein [Phycisphaerae bacterium]
MEAEQHIMTSPKRVMAVVLTLATAAIGQTAGTAPAVPKAGVAVAATEPAYTNTQRVPEDLHGTRRQVMILPREPGEAGEDFESSEEVAQRSGGVLAKIPAEQHRLPEGYVIGSRPGRIERQGEWFIAWLEPQEDLPDAPPLRILPNRELAMAEAILKDGPEAPQFLLTGRITEFQGANYLLLEHVAQLAARQEPAEPPASSPADSGKDNATPGGEPSPEAIIQHLMREEPRRALVLPVASQPAQVSGSPETAGGEAADWSEGTFLIDCLGRVVPGGDQWWTLAWEDRGDLAKRKPIRLLPNRLLETALALSGGGTRGLVLIVSGEVTEYKGIHYFLLRKVLVRRDLGNLR